MTFSYTCSLSSRKFCGKHRMPELHQCTHIRAFKTKEFRQLKKQKITNLENSNKKTITFMEDIEKEMRSDEVEELIQTNPDIISFGKERVDLFVGLLLIVWATSFIQFVFGIYSLLDILFITILIGPAFILHELGHKYSAIYFGKRARFVIKKRGAGLTLLMGLIPFGIAGPGVATVFDQSSSREMGIFSWAGPMVNVGLVFSYLLVFRIFSNALEPFTSIFLLGIRWTIGLGLFNMIPFGPLDGKKILNWSPPAYVFTIVLFVSEIFITIRVF